MNSDEKWREICSLLSDTAKLEATCALLEWDDRTCLPAKGGGFRADQIAMLSGLIHQRRTTPRLGELLSELAESDLVAERHQPIAASILRLKKDFDRHVRLPMDLVEATARATALGQQAWDAARKTNSWHEFKPHLETIFSLRRQEAELLRTDGSLYDALLDQYEEGAKAANLTLVFAKLRDSLVDLLQRSGSSANPPAGQTWAREVGLSEQRVVSRWIAQEIGYSFDRGRLDETSHPFCTTLGPDDCRILTRYQQTFFPSGFYGTLHEAGHGLYEQGLPRNWYGLPAGSAASLGVHESQSRMWENLVGRSQAFWQWCLPHLKRQWGSTWNDVEPFQAYRDANRVQASLIRVEADEVTYNLHILIRFEIEQELLSGELSVDDAPQAWNDRYSRYLNIRPRTYADGILQDVHWSAGLVGYFPTYTLGNLYAAQLIEAAKVDLGDVDRMFSSGEFNPLLQWLLMDSATIQENSYKRRAAKHFVRSH
jgi:carboxypeptidase Taq